MSKPAAEPEAKPTSPEACPRCKGTNSTILRKEPVMYGHNVIRKCDSCGNIWTSKATYGRGAWR